MKPPADRAIRELRKIHATVKEFFVAPSDLDLWHYLWRSVRCGGEMTPTHSPSLSRRIRRLILLANGVPLSDGQFMDLATFSASHAAWESKLPA